MKRARTAFRANRGTDSPEGEQGFWPSFADMMSSFALILFFLMLIAYLQNLITGNNLISTQEVLANTEAELSDTRLVLSTTKQEVEDAKLILSGLTVQLEDAEAAILEQQDQMALYAATIDGQSATIEQQTSMITTQNALIEDQKAYIALTTEELTTLRTQMQTIALLRLSVLEKVRNSISTTLGDASKVSVSESGGIVLDESLMFDYNSSMVKAASYPMLDSLTTAFANFLSDPENAKYVDSIVISGHTDNTGSSIKNRELSTARANAVLSYLLEKNGKVLEPYASYFCAAGYGSTRPVADNSTANGRTKNRRIEISIILKDESVMTLVDAYLKEQVPDTIVSTTP